MEVSDTQIPDVVVVLPTFLMCHSWGHFCSAEVLLQYGTTRDTIIPLCKFLTARSKILTHGQKHTVNLLDKDISHSPECPPPSLIKDSTSGKQLVWESWHKGIYDLTNTPGSSQLGQDAWEVT